MLFKVEDEISQALPDKSALLQYTVYRTADPLDGSGKIVSDPRYVVFYIERGQPIVVSDLGPARPINEKIQLFLRSIKKNSEPEIRRLGIELYNLLLRPVAHRFSDLEQIFISPDWEISSVPFYSLVSDGRYLLNTKLLISHVHSGRDILDWQIDPGAEKRVDLTGEKSVILIGDVNYNAPYDTHSDEGSIVTDELVRLLESSSLSTDPRLRFYPLAGSREEIKQISAVLPNVLVLRGSQASEDRVRSLRGASIIHFATHGYAFSKIDPVLAEMLMHKHRFTDEDFEILLADFHSGISLAGANVRQFKGGDGLLSAAEIAYLDWRDTELVVMSACETGTGVRSSGEGVFGIANALRIAGVKSSLLTLWPVADLSTADFMGAFYAELKKGTSRARAAKFAAISVQQTGYDSPYFWAPFVLYGEASPIWLQ